MKKAICLLMIAAACCTAARAQGLDDEEYPDKQYISWGLTVGANASSWLSDVSPLVADSLIGEEMAASPFAGIEAGIWAEYHISDLWSLRPTLGLSLENLLTTLGNSESALHTHLMTTFGVGLELPIFWRQPMGGGQLLAGIAPYSHFVFGSHLSGNAVNPYTVPIASDPGGEQEFAMSTFHSGVSLHLGYEFGNHWQLALVYKQGLTDLVNFNTDGAYIYPWKLTVAASYHFL